MTEALKSAKFLAEIKRLNQGGITKSAVDAESKDELLAGSKISIESQDKDKRAVAEGAETTANVLAEAGQRLQERGERLSRLQESSSKLMNASNDFALMATQLRQQQQKQNSWW
jgi:hypothetical protein